MGDTVIKIGAGQISGELRARVRKTPGELQRAMQRSALHARALLTRRTPKDLGEAKAGWTSSQFVKGATRARIDVYNRVPHVGILEHGARPHPVSLEGRMAIYEWVRRHYNGMEHRLQGPRQRKNLEGLKNQEIQDIATAIVRKIRKKGQKATYFVRNSIPELERDFAVELNKQIDAYSKRRASRGTGSK